MRDNIILCLWIAYTIGFGLFGVYLDQKADAIEMFGLSCIFAQLILPCYILLVGGFNALVGSFKFRIKLNPTKRFKNKVTPIYKFVPNRIKNYCIVGSSSQNHIDFFSAVKSGAIKNIKRDFDLELPNEWI